jgi:hypothetical protein
MARTAVTKKTGISDRTLTKQGPLEEKEAGMGEGIEVRVVLTVKNKMKEKLLEKIEDSWEYFINGIGKGITIQLVSEEIDPGEVHDIMNSKQKIHDIIKRDHVLLNVC